MKHSAEQIKEFSGLVETGRAQKLDYANTHGMNSRLEEAMRRQENQTCYEEHAVQSADW